ncbi:MAG: PepSY domain-containing protein [Pseudomonadota bacterium]|nr:PepSY domain-containing protein [Pseudomonadota bacterium]
MKTKLTTIALAGLLATGALAGTARAASNDENREATALQSARVTLSQAIAVAEQQTGGKAFDAGVDTKSAQTRIAVETNGAKGIQTVTVDAESGRVVGTHAGGETD